MFENAKVEAKANIYFDGKVTSRTLHLENGEAVTLGFMLEGSYTFNTQKRNYEGHTGCDDCFAA